MGRCQFVMLVATQVWLEEELQMAHPAVPWGMVVTETAAAAVRHSNNDIVTKGTCIAARVSGSRKLRTGVNDTGWWIIFLDNTSWHTLLLYNFVNKKLSI
jgi:hypothetical protein